MPLIGRLSPSMFRLALALTALLIGGIALLVSFKDYREKAAISSEDVFTALSQGDMSRVIFCLKAKPDLVNAKDKSGNSPLHVAASKNMADTTLVLLNMGGDPGLKNAAGKTPAEVAQEKGATAVSRLLQEKTGAK